MQLPQGWVRVIVAVTGPNGLIGEPFNDAYGYQPDENELVAYVPI